MSWVDNVIFAVAPLGIITAVISAIRVSGPPWLRAVVGRARENRAATEVELLSSGSDEVCELWNGQAIVRTTGKPEILQIVYLPECRDDENFGLYSLEEATKAKLLAVKGERQTSSFHSP